MFWHIIVCLFAGRFIYDPTFFEIDIVILLCGVLLVNLWFCWCSWICASWYNCENNQQDALYRLIYYSKSALHVSGDVFAHHQEHLTVFTVSGSVHPSCCRLPAGAPRVWRWQFPSNVRLRMSRSVPPLPKYVIMACTRESLPFLHVV